MLSGSSIVPCRAKFSDVTLPVDFALGDRLAPITDPMDVAVGLGVLFMQGILDQHGLEAEIDNSVDTIDVLDACSLSQRHDGANQPWRMFHRNNVEK